MTADQGPPPMHDEFPRWMHELDLGTRGDSLERRWAGVASIVAEFTPGDVEALVRLSFRTRALAATTPVQKFRAAFRKTDPEFEVHGNDRELEVLAGACLVALFAQETPTSSVAALAITTAAAGGARKPKLPMDLVGLAEAAILDLTESNSQRPDLLQHMPTEAPKVDFRAAATKVEQQFDAASVVAAFQLAAKATSDALATTACRQAAAVRAINTYSKHQDEELQMLWWLVGERSWDFNCAFDAVPADVQPLVFAKELATLTEFLPGPAAVKALLSRAGLRERRTLALKDAVNGTDQTWLGKLVENDDPSPVTQPIHFAIKRQLETGAGAAWVSGWAATTGIKADHALTPLALGHLFYRERLLRLLPGA
jgi:hypothetical protein